MTNRQLLMTMTGEEAQLARLHYQVFDQRALLTALGKLNCVQQDPTQKRWVWLHDHEAKDLQFTKPYAQIPKEQRPILLGSFYGRGSDKLLLDLRSFKRACFAISFFDRFIPRSAARVIEAEIYNKLLSADDKDLLPHHIFDKQPTPPYDPDLSSRFTKKLTGPNLSPEEQLKLLDEQIEEQCKVPMPETERMPIHFYQEGIDRFAGSLKVRQLVAYQHWQGNTSCTVGQMIKEMTLKMVASQLE